MALKRDCQHGSCTKKSTLLIRKYGRHVHVRRFQCSSWDIWTNLNASSLGSNALKIIWSGGQLGSKEGTHKTFAVKKGYDKLTQNSAYVKILFSYLTPNTWCLKDYFQMNHDMHTLIRFTFEQKQLFNLIKTFFIFKLSLSHSTWYKNTSLQI